ncbi:MAG: hypothetical protein C5B50_06800, partial [Verrucomicrobia bacterium]
TAGSWEIQEAGWTLQMPSTCDHFSWNRAGRWTWYPVTDIGRAAGTATPDSTNADYTNMSLTNAFDFNSTKFDCNWATLATAAGAGLGLTFSPAQLFHCRARAATSGGGYVLDVNQEVSMPDDFTSPVVPDQLFSLSSGNTLSGSFTIGSVSAGMTSSNAVASITGIKPLLSSTPGGSEFGVMFNGTTNTSYSLWSTTNFLNWTWDAPASEISSGHYQFFDPSSTNTLYRYYRISSP